MWKCLLVRKCAQTLRLSWTFQGNGKDSSGVRFPVVPLLASHQTSLCFSLHLCKMRELALMTFEVPSLCDLMILQGQELEVNP